MAFNKNAKIEIKVDQDKLDKFLADMERLQESIDAAAARAGEAVKQLKEAGDSAAKKANDAAKELAKAADKARNSRPPRGSGGRA